LNGKSMAAIVTRIWGHQHHCRLHLIITITIIVIISIIVKRHCWYSYYRQWGPISAAIVFVQAAASGEEKAHSKVIITTRRIVSRVFGQREKF
jgi:hypothetical protein